MRSTDRKDERENDMTTTKNTKGKAAEATDEAPAEETFSAKDLATEAGTDPKSFRRWLRTHTDERANKGGRWVFSAEAKADTLAAYAKRNDKPAEEAPAKG
jgi:hypothetical protein